MPHLTGCINMPLHHRDPFDRLIIAQAKEEDMLIVSSDDAFVEYDIDLLW
jgi:PIN domain nuclease of toxin-antitoxin system